MKGALHMNLFITKFNSLNTIVAHIFSSLKLPEREHPQGRIPTLTNSTVVASAIFKQRQNIATKKSLWEILEPSLSYQKFVDAINRSAKYLARVTVELLAIARTGAHPVKFTDATDIPVCLVKNANHHRTMQELAAWSKTGKGWFYGLKLHLSADLDGRVLALKFTPGNSDDRSVFKKMNAKLKGLFVADAGYVSHELEQDFAIEGERLLLTATRANMRKLATDWQVALLNLRMRVEIHFRVLKLCYGLVTSFPRSIDGYLTHYLACVSAYLIA